MAPSTLHSLLPRSRSSKSQECNAFANVNSSAFPPHAPRVRRHSILRWRSVRLNWVISPDAGYGTASSSEFHRFSLLRGSYPLRSSHSIITRLEPGTAHKTEPDAAILGGFMLARSRSNSAFQIPISRQDSSSTIERRNRTRSLARLLPGMCLLLAIASLPFADSARAKRDAGPNHHHGCGQWKSRFQRGQRSGHQRTVADSFGRCR
jgi:hypothetical protein